MKATYGSFKILVGDIQLVIDVGRVCVFGRWSQIYYYPIVETDDKRHRSVRDPEGEQAHSSAKLVGNSPLKKALKPDIGSGRLAHKATGMCAPVG